MLLMMELGGPTQGSAYCSSAPLQEEVHEDSCFLKLVGGLTVVPCCTMPPGLRCVVHASKTSEAS